MTVRVSNFLVQFGLVLVTLLGLENTVFAQSAKKRPNVLVVVTDDHGWNDVGFHNKELKFCKLRPGRVWRRRNRVSSRSRLPA